MVAQAASNGRRYALIIALNYVYRGPLPLFPSPQPDRLSCIQNDGRMHFVAALVSLAFVNDPFGGYSFDNSQIALPAGDLWKVVGWLFIWNCIRGRATQVIRISRVSQAEKPKVVSIKPGPLNGGVGGQYGRVVSAAG
jgi:hypothetical protein